MLREKMAGENLREDRVEVAFEQWTERISEQAPTEFPPLEGKQYRKVTSRTDRAQMRI